jgi:uncharacterized protein YpmB
MMTSKFKAYGTFALILSGLLFAGICFFIYTLISVFFLGGHIIPRGTLPPIGAIIFIIVFTFLLIAIFNSWIHYAFNIEIDNDEKTIFFQNIITRQTRLYNFTDFDSYLDTYPVTGKGGSYKVLYLLKDKKAKKIITGFYYENIDELQEAISSIKYLGFQKNFSSIARKALFNRPIIDD